MKKQFKEINFVNNQSKKFQFDLVNYEDILKKKPSDHSQFEYHKLSFYTIFLVTQKSGKFNVNFKDYDLKRGTLFTVREGNVHKFYNNNAKGFLLVFTENFILNHTNEQEASKSFLLFNEMLASPRLQLSEEEFKEIIVLIKLIKEEYSSSKDTYTHSIIRGYIQVIITKLLRIKSEENIVFDYNKYLSMFLQLQKIVERDCFYHKKVSYYAKEMGVTTKTLNNVTQSIIDKTVKTFINENVIVQSKILIINSSKNLTEIAYEVGFDDPTNFFKFFRKYTGYTPRQFRASQ